MIAESSPVLLDPTRAPRYLRCCGSVLTGPEATSQSLPCLEHQPQPVGVSLVHFPFDPEPSVKKVILAVWSEDAPLGCGGSLRALLNSPLRVWLTLEKSSFGE